MCVDDGEPEELRVGDLVWAAPGERHLHGAGGDTLMTHLAVSLGDATWFDEVTAEEFGA